VIRLRCGDDVRSVELRSTPDGLQVEVDGAAQAVEVERVGEGSFLARMGARHQPFHCVREGARIWLFWEGATYLLEEEAEAARGAQRSHGHLLEAPMPGRVIAVKVVPGQAVVRGEEVLVVEAMKMENAIRAPRDGVVKSVSAAVGDMVNPGVVLVVLE